MILRNGVEMPNIGFGTWQIGEGKQVTEVVENAIETGYKLIDTAYSYGNEFFIGKAIKNAGENRNNLFIQGKVWNDCLTEDDIYNACKKSLRMLKIDYFDSYLIHWPFRGDNEKEINYHRWLGMLRLLKDGMVKSVGVSNYTISDFENLKDKNVQEMPMINQVECHIGCFDAELIKYCKENNIAVQAWSPLDHGKVLNNNEVIEKSKEYNLTPSQYCIKFLLDNGICPIPKTTKISRMKENLILN